MLITGYKSGFISESLTGGGGVKFTIRVSFGGGGGTAHTRNLGGNMLAVLRKVSDLREAKKF